MAFDFSQYPSDPTYNNTTGQPVMDPSQLQGDPSQMFYKGGSATFDESAGGGSGIPIDPGRGISFDPSMTSPSSPMAGGGGLTGGNLGTPTSSQDPQAFFNQLFPGQSLSPEMLAQHEAELKAQGITIIRNAAGQPSKIRLPDGSVIDPIIGAGSGQNQKAWNVVAGPGGAPMGGNVNGSAGSVLGGLGYQFGASMAPYTGQFTAPTAQQALDTPGLQFALSEANRMGQNSAAAKGTLLNGRFQQALNASNIQNALQGYGDVFNRQQQLQAANYGIFKDNQDRPFDKNYNLALLGKPA